MKEHRFAYFFYADPPLVTLTSCHRNNNDTIAVMPMTNYHHIGMQVRLYKEVGREPLFTYPSEDESYRQYVGRLWQNSLITSFNLGYDHGDYRERVDKDQLSLVKYDLNDLYEDTKMTGFKLDVVKRV